MSVRELLDKQSKLLNEELRLKLNLWLDNKKKHLNSDDTKAIVCALAKTLHRELTEIIQLRQEMYKESHPTIASVEAAKKLHQAFVNQYEGTDRQRISDILNECLPGLTDSIRRSVVAHSRPRTRRPTVTVPPPISREPEPRPPRRPTSTQDGGIAYKKTDRKVRVQQKERVLYLGKNNRHFVKINGSYVSVASFRN
jgi:hypothetical protein